MAKLMILGASGLLGANLVADTEGRGFDRLAASFQTPLRTQGLNSCSVDLRDPAAAEALMAGFAPDIVICCAAATNVDWCEDHPAEANRLNAEVPGHLAALCRRIGARFVHISSESVFEGTRGLYTELDPPNPINAYALSKREGEIRVGEANPAALIIRTTIYGWNAQPKLSLSEWILRELRNQRAITGFGDAYFSPILVNDLGDLLFRLLAQDAQGIFHIGSQDACSKLEFARELARVFGLDEGLVQEGRLAGQSFKAKRPLNVSLSSAKAIALAGDAAWPTVRSGLERLKHLEGIGRVRLLKGMLPGEIHERH